MDEVEIGYVWGVRYLLMPDEVIRVEHESDARAIASHGQATLVRAKIGPWEDVE